DAVYGRNWADVVNFVSLDPMYAAFDAPPPPTGVRLQPWTELVEPEHRHVSRWYSPSMLGAWSYGSFAEFSYGDDTTYEKGIAFLDGHGTIEDWGCGFAHAKTFVTRSRYVGVDGSSPRANKIA